MVGYKTNLFNLLNSNHRYLYSCFQCVLMYYNSKLVLVLILLSFLIISCKNDRDIKDIISTSGRFLEVKTDSSLAGDSVMEDHIYPYRIKMDSVMDEIVGFSNREIYKKKPNGSLNNFVADILYDRANKFSNVKADFCLLNYGGLRRPLPAGNIQKSSIFQLMPFENETVLVKLKPKAMKLLLYYLYRANGQPVSNLEVHYQDSNVVSVNINNQPWDSTKSYWVVTSDYTANGGDKMAFFAQRDSIILTGVLIRDAIFDYLDSLQNHNINLEADSNIRIFMQ